MIVTTPLLGSEDNSPFQNTISVSFIGSQCFSGSQVLVSVGSPVPPHLAEYDSCLLVEVCVCSVSLTQL